MGSSGSCFQTYQKINTNVIPFFLGYAISINLAGRVAGLSTLRLPPMEVRGPITLTDPNALWGFGWATHNDPLLKCRLWAISWKFKSHRFGKTLPGKVFKIGYFTHLFFGRGRFCGYRLVFESSSIIHVLETCFWILQRFQILENALLESLAKTDTWNRNNDAGTRLSRPESQTDL